MRVKELFLGLLVFGVFSFALLLGRAHEPGSIADGGGEAQSEQQDLRRPQSFLPRFLRFGGLGSSALPPLSQRPASPLGACARVFESPLPHSLLQQVARDNAVPAARHDVGVSSPAGGGGGSDASMRAESGGSIAYHVMAGPSFSGRTLWEDPTADETVVFVPTQSCGGCPASAERVNPNKVCACARVCARIDCCCAAACVPCRADFVVVATSCWQHRSHFRAFRLFGLTPEPPNGRGSTLTRGPLAAQASWLVVRAA